MACIGRGLAAEVIGLDFALFWQAARAVLEGRSPYSVSGFYSPLPFAWALSPLALLPFLQPIAPRPVDLWLAAQPEQGSIMELPPTSALSAPQMLYTRYHQKPIAFAYGTFIPYWYRQQYSELERCPASDCLARLRRWGVDFGLLNLGDSSGGPSPEEKLNQSAGLERLARVGDNVVYRLLH